MSELRAVEVHPLLAVEDIDASRAFYAAALGATGSHGGHEHERLRVDGHLVLQLHGEAVEHHHGALRTPGAAAGDGLLLWFAVRDFDARVEATRAHGAEVVRDVHHNPNAMQRELWLRDPDGYLVVLAEQVPALAD